MDASNVPVLVLSVCALLLCFISLCLLIRQFHTERSSAYSPPPAKVRRYSYCALLSFLASTIASIIDAADDPSFAQEILNDAAITISWSFGQFFVFTVMLTRIHYTLKGTKHALHDHNYVVFGVLILVSILLSVVWIMRSTLYYTKYSSGDIDENTVHIFGVFFVSTTYIIDVVASIFFVVIFVAKLRVIEFVNNESATPLRIRKQMTKYWVLSLIIIINTQIIFFILSLIFITRYFGAVTAASVFTEMFVLLLPINIVTVISCLLLMFSVFEKQYDRRCRICNDAAVSCFAKLEKRTSMLNRSLLEEQPRAPLVQL